jgi:hypothetical protein
MSTSQMQIVINLLQVCEHQAAAVCSHQVETGLLFSAALLQTVNDKPVATCFHQTCCKLFWTSLLPLVFNSIAASCAHQLAADLRSSSCDRQVTSGLSRLDVFIRADATCHQLASAR